MARETQVTNGPTGQRNGEAIAVDCDERDHNPYRRTSFPATPQTIAICTVGELFGGVERHVIGMLKSLKSRRIRVLLILFHDGELAVQVRELGFEPVILPKHNLDLLTTGRAIARMLKKHNVGVLHVHGYKATVFCAIARRWYPCAMVKTEHGLPEPMATGPIGAWRNRLYHLCDSVATQIAGSAVCYVTKDLQKHYQRMHSGLCTTVIPNGVENMDRRQFPRPAEVREDWFNLLVVGRLDTVKGHHLAIEAMASESLAPDVHLYLVGLGPREHELGALADSLNLASRVHILGFRRNVYDYIAHCDALLMPSLHEGLPYTLLEAMALATPIIASRVGGLAEVLQHDETALLTPAQDVGSLAGAIIRLHNDRALRSRLAATAQRLQQTRYSLASMSESYLEVYRTHWQRLTNSDP
jgi:glycosyltransferase involved in cell wall biosynthesis